MPPRGRRRSVRPQGVDLHTIERGATAVLADGRTGTVLGFGSAARNAGRASVLIRLTQDGRTLDIDCADLAEVHPPA